MTCPKCGSPKNPGETCDSCGVIYSKAKPPVKSIQKDIKITAAHVIVDRFLALVVVVAVIGAYSVYNHFDKQEKARLQAIEDAKPPAYGQWAYHDDYTESFIRLIEKREYSHKCNGLIAAKKDHQHDGSYMVACSPDNKNWNFYVINLRKGSVRLVSQSIFDEKITPPAFQPKVASSSISQ